MKVYYATSNVWQFFLLSGREKFRWNFAEERLHGTTEQAAAAASA